MRLEKSGNLQSWGDELFIGYVSTNTFLTSLRSPYLSLYQCSIKCHSYIQEVPLADQFTQQYMQKFTQKKSLFLGIRWKKCIGKSIGKNEIKILEKSGKFDSQKKQEPWQFQVLYRLVTNEETWCYLNIDSSEKEDAICLKLERGQLPLLGLKLIPDVSTRKD